MRKPLFTAIAFAALSIGALATGGAASAEPVAGANAQDTIQTLMSAGYQVQINGLANAPLSKCKVLGVHGLSGTMTTMEEVMAMNPAVVDTVYVDVSCPTLSS